MEKRFIPAFFPHAGVFSHLLYDLKKKKLKKSYVFWGQEIVCLQEKDKKDVTLVK